MSCSEGGECKGERAESVHSHGCISSCDIPLADSNQRMATEGNNRWSTLSSVQECVESKNEEQQDRHREQDLQGAQEHEEEAPLTPVSQIIRESSLEPPSAPRKAKMPRILQDNRAAYSSVFVRKLDFD